MKEKEYVFKLDEWYAENGLKLNLNIQFMPDDNGKTMKILSCNVDNGYNSIDYEFVLGSVTLESVIKDFLCD